MPGFLRAPSILSLSIHGDNWFCRHSSLHEIPLICLLSHGATEGCVQLRGLRFLMAQNRLHGNEGRALIEQYGCEGMAKLVGADLGLQVGSIRDPIGNVLNLMNRHPGAVSFRSQTAPHPYPHDNSDTAVAICGPSSRSTPLVLCFLSRSRSHSRAANQSHYDPVYESPPPDIPWRRKIPRARAPRHWWNCQI